MGRLRPAPAASAAAAAAATLLLSGCAAATAPPPAPATTTETAAATTADPRQLPPPEALGDVLLRLADPAVPGRDKITLLQNGAGPDAGVLDSFTTALRDGGYLPLTVTARDLQWSAVRPDDVIATVTISGPTTATDRSPEFSTPMEFTPGPQGWQLTRTTAESLFAYGGR